MRCFAKALVFGAEVQEIEGFTHGVADFLAHDGAEFVAAIDDLTQRIRAAETAQTPEFLDDGERSGGGLGALDLIESLLDDEVEQGGFREMRDEGVRFFQAFHESVFHADFGGVAIVHRELDAQKTKTFQFFLAWVQNGSIVTPCPTCAPRLPK